MAVSPALLTLISVGVGLAGTAVSTFSQISAANYQAQIAERNKEIMLENAKRAITASQQAQVEQDRKSAFLLGQQEAAQSASGLSLGGRSQMLTRKAARELARMDALNVRQAGEIEAYNFRVMAEDAASKAQFLKNSTGSLLLEGFLGGGATIIGGAGKLYDQGFLNPSATNYLKVA